MSNAEVLQAFDAHQQARGLSARTIDRRHTSLHGLEAFLAPLPLLEATPELIEEWLSGFKRAETKHAYLGDLRTMFKWATKRGLIVRNPTEDLQSVRRPQPLPRPIGEEDLGIAMLIAQPRVRLVLVLGAFAGLRRFEIAPLRAEDVTQRIVIVRDGKGGKGRILPTHPAIWAAYRAHGVDEGWLFRNGQGAHVRPNTIGTWVRELFAEVGVKSTLHKTRHRFGTRLAEAARGDMRMVQAGLGHAHLATSEYYVAFDPTRLSEVVHLLPDLPMAEA